MDYMDHVRRTQLGLGRPNRITVKRSWHVYVNHIERLQYAVSVANHKRAEQTIDVAYLCQPLFLWVQAALWKT